MIASKSRGTGRTQVPPPAGRFARSLIWAATASLAVVLIAACATVGPAGSPPTASTRSVVGSAAGSGSGSGTAQAASAAAVNLGTAASCHSVNGLPDHHCTPGAVNPAVTAATIGSTICKSGWTATIRPPASYTNQLKRQQIAQYGYADRKLSDYEEDHLIPLELGGAPRAAANLWPQFDGGKIPNPKDAVENALKRAVCAHKVGLTAAQRAIAANWKTAERVLGLTAPAPAPAPSPSPKPGVLSCRASVSNSSPADYSTVDVYVQTSAGASVTTIAHYKTTDNQKSATAGSSGAATIAYYISRATPGYQVLVSVTTQLGSKTASCSTAFTPR